MVCRSPFNKPTITFLKLIAFLSVSLYPYKFKADELSPSLLVDYAYLRKAHQFYDPGTVHLFLKNLSESAVSIEAIWLNDIPLEDLPNDIAIWWRAVPNPIAPQKVGDIIIKLKRPLSTPLKVRVKTTDGKTVEQSVDTSYPPLKITYVGFSEELNKIYIYLENLGDEALNVERIYLDSLNITDSIATSWRGIPPHNKNCLIINLMKGLKQGDYITLKIETKERQNAEATIRVFSAFPITAWDGDTREELYFDTYPFLIPYSPTPSRLEENRKKPANMMYLLADDPVGEDMKANSSMPEGWSEELLIGASAEEIISYAEECYRYDPIHSVSLCLRDSGKPSAYFIYGELADALLIHPCENVYYQHRPIRDGYWTALGKLACEPRPLYVLPEAFKAIGRCGASPRYPTPEELRLIVHYEIAQGAKGVIFFKRSGENGYEANPSLKKEIKKLNRELQKMKNFLRIGEPFSLAETTNPQVEAYSLLCGDEAIILLLINHDHESDFHPEKEAFRCRPKKNFAVTLNIPSWLGVKEVYEISEGGNTIPLRYRKLSENKILIYIKELELTKQIVVRTRMEKGSEEL
ncbi:hypothetical protein H5T87_08720 [bacterium]|nr:hypothetical protein [bacterium]